MHRSSVMAEAYSFELNNSSILHNFKFEIVMMSLILYNANYLVRSIINEKIERIEPTWARM